VFPVCRSAMVSNGAFAQSDEHRALESGMRAVLDLDPFAAPPGAIAAIASCSELVGGSKSRRDEGRTGWRRSRAMPLAVAYAGYQPLSSGLNDRLMRVTMGSHARLSLAGYLRSKQ
jgi:hypothetical protein